MKKILVLGGNGFIGQNLCKFLVEQSEEVYSFDITLPKEKVNRITYLEGDFFDDYILKDMIKDMDIIYHAICTMNPGNSNEKYMAGYERDFVQTAKLCSWIKDTSTKLIFLSSGGTVYGNQKTQPIKEEAVPVPINHYGNLKLCIENTIRTFNFQSQKNMLIARISNPYGPGQDYQKGVGFIDAAIKKSICGEILQIWGDGETVRDYIYITDVCKMLYALANYDGEHCVFNLGSGIGTSQNKIIQILSENEIDCKVEYTSARAVDVKKMVLDNARIREVLGISLIDIQEGISNYINYIKSQKEV